MAPPPIFPEQYFHITANCFINMPFDRVDQYKDLLLRYRFQPEISLDGEVLYSRRLSDFERFARLLETEGLRCTLHAPFQDLAPGAVEPRILEATRYKLKKAFELIPLFKPQSIVCHANFEEHKHASSEEQWFGQSLATWQELLPIAEANRTFLMLENTYEKDSTQLSRILAALDSPWARFCLDIGHVHAFAGNTWQDWLPAMDPWLGQLHLHDNSGTGDDHIAIGQGVIDFSAVFEYLSQKGFTPILTLEPHSEEALWGSLAALDRMGIFSSKGFFTTSP